MQRTMLNSKIHRLTVTGADLNYVGSITLDPVLLEAANILPFEKVSVVDVTNGARLETYAIAGEPGGGAAQLNGAAAHLVSPGDLIIVMSYVQVEDPILENWQPRIVFVDERNQITETRGMRAQAGLVGA